jgi:hypothetical protein
MEDIRKMDTILLLNQRKNKLKTLSQKMIWTLKILWMKREREKKVKMKKTMFQKKTNQKMSHKMKKSFR